MLWILLLCSVIVIIVFFFKVVIEVVANVGESKKNWEMLWKYILILSITCLVSLVSVKLTSKALDSCYEEVLQTDEKELVSIADNSQVSGKASGTIFYIQASMDTEEVYSFYYRITGGGFKKGKIEAKKAVIYEENNCKPRVVEITTYTKSKMGSVLDEILLFGTEIEEKSYKIYIPKGSICRDFSLDAQ
ncbi:MAG: hypothetical protein Q4G05_03705 [Clostridia bacterium]|nr:hypothetical protein [Clostridia bacterium]